MNKRSMQRMLFRPNIHLDEFHHPHAIAMLSGLEGKALATMCAVLLENGARSAKGIDSGIGSGTPVGLASKSEVHPQGANGAQSSVVNATATESAPQAPHPGTLPADAMADFLALPPVTELGA